MARMLDHLQFYDRALEFLLVLLAGSRIVGTKTVDLGTQSHGWPIGGAQGQGYGRGEVPGVRPPYVVTRNGRHENSWQHVSGRAI
jgi:hypothetical protein